jgi:hypothetical protein
MESANKLPHVNNPSTPTDSVSSFKYELEHPSPVVADASVSSNKYLKNNGETSNLNLQNNTETTSNNNETSSNNNNNNETSSNNNDETTTKEKIKTETET